MGVVHSFLLDRDSTEGQINDILKSLKKYCIEYTDTYSK